MVISDFRRSVKKEFKECLIKGTTLLFVSHSIDQVAKFVKNCMAGKGSGKTIWGCKRNFERI